MSSTRPRFRDIEQLIRCDGGHDVPWSYLEKQIANEPTLDLDPDFQRGHVWSESKQREYIEFSLRGGTSARTVYLNCPGYSRCSTTDYADFVLVDGKQRITAIRKFMASELRAFGHYLSEYSDTLGFWPHIRWAVNELQTRADVLRWYLQLNSGGVVHTQDELERVRSLLKAEAGQ